MAVRLTQLVSEIIISPSTVKARLTQLVTEILVLPTTQKARLTQLVTEILVLPTTQKARLTQLSVEVLTKPNPNVRLTQQVIEVLRSTTDATLNNVSLSQSISLAQVITYNLVITKSLSQSISLSQIVDYDQVINLSVLDSISLSQTTTESNQKSPIVTQAITLSDLISFNVIYNLSLTDNIIISQTISSLHIFPLSSSNNIILDHLVNYIYLPGIIQVSHHINLNQQPFKFVDIGNEIVYFPLISVQIIPKKCVVILACNELNIVLPCPLLGDSEANISSLNTKRTMTGLLYNYVKSSNLRKLVYEFELERNKAYELLVFLKKYMSNLIHLNNWKGESWICYIINNPIDFITKGLWQGDSCNTEYVLVKLEFEGYKIIG